MPSSRPSSAAAKFAAFDLDSRLLSALVEQGWTDPSPIQRAAIPALLDGRDVLGQAGTGTGKTAAFGLPLLHRLLARRRRTSLPQALVLVPTRELATQVARALAQFGGPAAPEAAVLVGGQSFGAQMQALHRGASIIVATPGRLRDHLSRGRLNLGEIEMLVLDEADEMLDMGFADDLDAIMKNVPVSRQTALFSATLPRDAAAMVERWLSNPVRIRVAAEQNTSGGEPLLRQIAHVVLPRHKVAALRRVLAVAEPTACIVFCRTRDDVDGLREALVDGGSRTGILHGGLLQPERDRVMDRFRRGDINVLLATDVAARGLDVDHVSHVINFDVPTNAELYVHRIGRTGRAGRRGTAITLLGPHDQRRVTQFGQRTQAVVSCVPLPLASELRRAQSQRAAATIGEAALQTLAAEEVDHVLQGFSPEQLAQAALVLAMGPTNEEDALDFPSLPMSGAPHSSGSGRRQPPRRFAPPRRHRLRAARPHADGNR